ncbi:MAG TPA: transglycosylase family protein [Pseudonocardiaceae bacterium]|jgi:hypothetical protein|nr:transglycosylase family protein [Pseudonocardiaceae bacterium]
MPSEKPRQNRSRWNIALTVLGGASTAVAATGLLPIASHAATEAQPNWAAVIQCESGGNPTAQNAHSTASGLFQFLDSSWASYGGLQYAPRAKEATAAQQYAVAETAYRESGLSPWAASESCWGGHAYSRHSAPPSPSVRQQHAAPAASSIPTDQSVTAGGLLYTVASGDTLSAIGKRFNKSWQQVYDENRNVVNEPDLIYPGQVLDI